MRIAFCGLRGSFSLVTLLVFTSACTAQATPTSVISITAAITAQSSPAPRPAKTVTAISEPNSPTATLAPTKALTLIERQPSTEALENYLSNYGRSLYDNCAGISLVEPIFQDVNGDNQEDLVVLNSPELTVLLWTDAKYSEPILFSGDFLRGCPASSIAFEDWTGDGISEIVFNNGALGGGTGYADFNTTRYIIRCQASTCLTVWEGLIAREVGDGNSGGMAKFDFEITRKTETSPPRIEVRASGFGVYTFIVPEQRQNEQGRYSSLFVITSTLSTWVWSGDDFKPLEQQIIRLGYEIQSRATLLAQNTSGVAASISVTQLQVTENFYSNDLCQLNINNSKIGEPFGCKQNFTTVEWRDITQDGIEEVVITALSGAYDAEGNDLTKKHCVHQRLVAFQWNGENATPIANITGCVIREDLYGVLLKDFDDDGQTEVLAARIDFDSSSPRIDVTEIYKWNGSQFVFWDDVPGQP